MTLAIPTELSNELQAAIKEALAVADKCNKVHGKVTAELKLRMTVAADHQAQLC
ncbi:hypothetical protein PILCRDRAFT_7980 [Piloderma croceum F 1598]|uniref:Uncharacterized protein n=1 Tax=Piloderma croceum (strain F 1598) TaxID=765440 RepID=A0A0C3FDZ4_PILCF|nr:hypothetical protein PILCRDRAFT_7980 [Piloderma croceum F 1598]